MKILILHNRYKFEGGEEEVVNSEKTILNNHGNKVILYERSNKEIEKLSFSNKLQFLIKEMIWSKKTYNEIKSLVKREKPDIAHIHNIFFMISPSIYDALSEEGIPIVQSLHNYRFFCPKGMFYNNGKICEKCSNGNLTYSIVNRCWESSTILTLNLIRLMIIHNLKKTFYRKIDTYIASSEFSKNKYIELGLPKDKIFYKPNFINLSDKVEGKDKDYGLFIGRLINYKGIDTLISACKEVPKCPIKIIGNGPLYEDVNKKVSSLTNIQLLGGLAPEKKFEILKNSLFLIFPSECYENMPITILEAFAYGIPVIVSKVVAKGGVVENNLTGIHFETGDYHDLASKIDWSIKHSEIMKEMGKQARKEYEEKYTAKRNYEMLINIYEKTIQNYKKMKNDNKNSTLKNFQKKYTKDSPFIYEKNYFYDYFREIPFKRLKKLLEKNKIDLNNKTMLFPSCGSGIDAYFLKKTYKPGKICFTDIHMLAMEKTQSNFHNEFFTLTDNQHLAFNDSSFDYVFIAASLHHLKKPAEGIYELIRVAKKGLIVIEPNDSWLTRLFERLGLAHEYEVEHGNYVYRFNKREVEKLSKAIFFKYSVNRFFSIHRTAKTKVEFLLLKILNSLANFLCPNLGNYIIFIIKKEKNIPRCMKETKYL